MGGRKENRRAQTRTDEPLGMDQHVTSWSRISQRQLVGDLHRWLLVRQYLSPWSTTQSAHLSPIAATARAPKARSVSA